MSNIEHFEADHVQWWREAANAEHRIAKAVEGERDQLREELAEARQQLAGAVEALRAIRDELGVPSDDYAAPVANARKIADDWLTASGGQ